MKKGIFITYEGGEACGKSTQIKMLKDYVSTLENKDDFVFVREPGGTPLAEEIRKLLLNYEEDKPVPMTELLLMYSARAQLTQNIILPALKQGKIVIADRFYDSSIAYQGGARKVMSPEEILNLTKMVIGDLKPDTTIFLKLSPEEAFKRKNKMNEALDRMEKEGIEFHRDVQSGYDYISKIEPERFCVIDARKSPQEVFDEILKNLKNKYPKVF